MDGRQRVARHDGLDPTLHDALQYGCGGTIVRLPRLQDIEHHIEIQ
jgi:hypothetical protein